ncbi:aspartyl aminopeptidase [Alteromonadaceae bacterium Bs31]|nr:aspartyl aminopeptidase [Alteromonadaceae bacterium Bs31]
MTQTDLCTGLLEFIAASPTPFHATRSLAALLCESGFTRLNEKDAWQLQEGGRYFVVRGGSSLVAFAYGSTALAENGFRVIGAHTDSPCLKVKPSPELQTKGYYQLGIEVYGGALLNPWYDRDLSLAGNVVYLDASGELRSTLIDFVEPIATIPSLAIHLDREANTSRTVNPQTDMNVLLRQSDDKINFRAMLSELIDDDVQEVLDFNLSFYDTQPPGVVGLGKEFIASARLDNLLSCYLGAKALLNSAGEHTSILLCSDHEEVGSRSDIGAQGPLLEEIIGRLAGDQEARQRAMRRSVLISADNAHGVHPNYSKVHDDQHGPLLNKGPVIKFDANQSYATNSSTSALVRWLAKGNDADIPLQQYVTRADMRCGSTIGPITAAGLGITAVDIGLATFAMHSVRELAGKHDLGHMYELLSRFVSRKALPALDSL